MKRRVASFEDLEVYRLAFAMQQEIFRMSGQWPKSEQYSLTDQVRRSARAIGANIAEAWAKRRHAALDEKCRRIGAMLGRMMADSDCWTVGR